MQYLIYLTDGVEARCVLITSKREHAVKRLQDFKDIIYREDAYFELREYENHLTPEYAVISA